MRKQVVVVVLACLGIALGSPSLAGEDGHEAAEPGPRRPLTEADASAGRTSYLAECSACHGERGDGAGPAAEFVDPRPHDFTRKLFKFRTTASGQPPATADVLRIIERGLPGTAMPPFAFLAAAERREIAAHVLKLAGLLDGPEPEPLRVSGTPPPVTPETVGKGKEIYPGAGCASCHGDLGKGNGPSAKDLEDAGGRPIKPRDFTRDPFRGGSERVDLYYRLATGLDGTPMPSYEGAIDPPDLWAVVDYVRSLRVPAAAKRRPADPIKAGRAVAATYGCRGCHVLDDGRGGDVGPDLRLSGRKLYPQWVRGFLAAPRDYGKIYPSRVYRMPQLGLDDVEVDVMTKYVAAMGKRSLRPLALPDVASFAAAKLDEGKLTYTLRCAECHALGTVIETPTAKQQGPDLIRVAHRVDYAWAKDWTGHPKEIDPQTKTTVPDLTPEQADTVRMFVWKASLEAAGAGALPASAGR